MSCKVQVLQWYNVNTFNLKVSNSVSLQIDIELIN